MEGWMLGAAGAKQAMRVRIASKKNIMMTAQIPDAVLPDPFHRDSFEQLLVPIGPSSNESAQHPILIEDGDTLPQYDDTEPESDSGPSAEGELALLRRLKART